MSVLIKDNSNFIGLLIKTTFIQAQALLDTVTKNQIQVIAEIAKNLLTIPLANEIKEEVESNNKLLRKIASKDIGINKKARIISLHRKKLIKVLRKATPILEALITGSSEDIIEEKVDKNNHMENNVS